MNNYYVLDIDLRDPDGIAAEFDEALDALEDALQADGLDYFLTSDPYAKQLVVLIVPEKYLNGTYSNIDNIFNEVGLTYVVR